MVQRIANWVIGPVVVVLCLLLWPITLPILVCVLMAPDENEPEESGK